MSRYTSASSAMLEHRYGYNAGPVGTYDLLGDRIADEMFGSLPTQGTGTMQLQPVVSAGIDTGTVQLVPILPDPALTGYAEDGIEIGFAEFVREFQGRGR